VREVELAVEQPPLRGLLREAQAADPHGGGRGDRREQLHVALAEDVNAALRAQHDHAEAALAVEQRRRHQAAHARRHDALGVREAGVLARVGDERRHALLGHLAGERPRVERLAAHARRPPHGHARERSRGVPQEDGAFLGPQLPEGALEDQLRQRLQRHRPGERAMDLVQEAQPSREPAGILSGNRRGREQLRRRAEERAVREALVGAAREPVSRRGRSRPAARALQDDPALREPDHVADAQRRRLRDRPVVEERRVARAEVLEEPAALAQEQPRVLSREIAVGQHHVRLRRAPEHDRLARERVTERLAVARADVQDDRAHGALAPEARASACSRPGSTVKRLVKPASSSTVRRRARARTARARPAAASAAWPPAAARAGRRC
jgi:hypothetical protein